MAKGIILPLASWLLALIFIGVSIYSCKRKKPMNFFSTSEVDEREIKDVPSYNRANAVMWVIYSLIFIIIGIIGIIGYTNAATYMILFAVFLGIPVLAYVYNRIYNKYRNL